MKTKEIDAPQKTKLDRFLLAVDDSHESRRATSFVAALAKKVGAEVVVVHFREIGSGRSAAYDMETAGDAGEVLQEAVATLEAAGVKGRSEQHISREGAAGSHIQEFADTIDCDLIVMGTRGFSLVGALFAGSVSHDVIHGAHRPVLVVP